MQIPNNLVLDDKFMEIIPKFKRSKIKQMRKEIDKQRSLLSNALSCWILSLKLQKSINELEFYCNDYGKLFLKNEEYHFNISHSGSWICVVIDNQPLGVDIEKITNIDLTIAKRFFTYEENTYIDNSLDKFKAFFEIWTLKESYIKTIGTGFFLNLNSFSIIKNDEDFICKHQGQIDDYYFYQYAIEGYVIAVCSRKRNVDDIIVVDYESWYDEFKKIIM